MVIQNIIEMQWHNGRNFTKLLKLLSWCFMSTMNIAFLLKNMFSKQKKLLVIEPSGLFHHNKTW
jgi:hypothetical protein